MVNTTTATPKWHTAAWGTLGWLETIAKLIAVVIGFVALIGSSSALGFMFRSNPRLAAVIVFALLTIASVGVIAMRFQQKETISMVFAILSALGHIALLIALLRVPQLRRLPVAFAGFFILGQLIKLQYLRTSGYTEGGATTRGMLTVTGVLTAIYALFVIFMVV